MLATLAILLQIYALFGVVWLVWLNNALVWQNWQIFPSSKKNTLQRRVLSVIISFCRKTFNLWRLKMFLCSFEHLSLKRTSANSKSGKCKWQRSGNWQSWSCSSGKLRITLKEIAIVAAETVPSIWELLSQNSARKNCSRTFCLMFNEVEI